MVFLEAVREAYSVVLNKETLVVSEEVTKILYQQIDLPIKKLKE